MGSIRAFLRVHGRLALLLLALALAAKVVVPAGYMLGAVDGFGGKVLTISVCADAQGGGFIKHIVVPSTDKGDRGDEKGKDACAWSSLAFTALAVADAALLGAALLFILALGFSAAPRPRLARVAHLRPPLRGPPSLT